VSKIGKFSALDFYDVLDFFAIDYVFQFESSRCFQFSFIDFSLVYRSAFAQIFPRSQPMRESNIHFYFQTELSLTTLNFFFFKNLLYFLSYTKFLFHLCLCCVSLLIYIFALCLFILLYTLFSYVFIFSSVLFSLYVSYIRISFKILPSFQHLKHSFCPLNL
jgi:hypothetical protein